MCPAKKLVTMLPLTPTRLGRYEILEELGKGAMGVVYLARDPLIGRLVALKTFRIGYSVKDQELEQFRIRFMREAQSAGILTHPNIVTIHDVVEASEEGLAFIAMEYVKGTNLKLMLQGDRPLALPFVLDIIAQVGDALDYAHANRVIHRDVKPANILITPENRVKITDFGIARLESSNLTQEGQLLGTPNYMAPEQIQGKEVDHRADLFSLGVVLYEMLTRHKPFQGENLTVVSHRIVYDHFTPPRDYVLGLPPGIDRILAKALEKDPGRRYQRAREMVDDLRRVVESTSVQPDDLNETQSLSATMVLPPSTVPAPPAAEKPSGLGWWKKKTAPVPPPPVPVADPGTASRSGTTGSGGLSGTGSFPSAPVPDSAIAEADTVSTSAPVLTPPRPRTRVLRAAVVGLVLAVLVAAGLMLSGNWIQPDGSGRDAQEDEYRARVTSLVNQAHQQAEAEKYMEAVALLREAETLAPRSRTISEQRKAMEEKAIKFDQLVGKELEVLLAVQDAQQSLDGQRFEEAINKATDILLMQAGNKDAIEILAKAREGLAKTRQRATPTRPRGETPPGEEVASLPQPGEPAAPAEATPQAPASSEARTANLNVNIQSELPGTFIVRVNGSQKFRKDFKPRGRFSRDRGEPFSVSHTLLVTAGADFRLEVLVTPLDKKGMFRDVPVSQPFQGGSVHSLDIRLFGPNPDNLSVNLR
jgi:serine/threonine protein kinase